VDDQVDGEGGEEESPTPATVKKWQFWKKKSTGPKKFGWIKGVLVSCRKLQGINAGGLGILIVLSTFLSTW